MSNGERPTVLVVDDDQAIVDTYAAWLREDYDVKTATDGEAALERLGDEIDVVLLDRRMGDVSGDEVLERIQASSYDCRVAMVTGVEPDIDVIGMGFDAYLVKPVSRDELVGVVQHLLDRTAYRNDAMELFSLVSKKAVLEEEHPPAELDDSPEYQELVEKIERLRNETDGFIDDMTDTDFRAEMVDLGSSGDDE